MILCAILLFLKYSFHPFPGPESYIWGLTCVPWSYRRTWNTGKLTNWYWVSVFTSIQDNFRKALRTIYHYITITQYLPQMTKSNILYWWNWKLKSLNAKFINAHCNQINSSLQKANDSLRLDFLKDTHFLVDVLKRAFDDTRIIVLLPLWVSLIKGTNTKFHNSSYSNGTFFGNSHSDLQQVII